ASKSMFIHRNTMMYKLDKLKAESGFDLRNFKDACILYMLISTK
ncbi:MAG: helix-turn-helix domain-containing protein, partial [Acholeplasmatales bacterium]|nr:helix-turn-helix domain-containing protein [Acholeplasmatales bacterium]